MDIMMVDNDTRGWIMAAVSGVACIVGACVICVDLVVRLIPGKQDFKIQESNTFLASSLSLSFGVMLFSALYSMLPSSKKYLIKAGYDDLESGMIMMACFVGGFVGIQGLSRLLHRLIPSHVVDCDHSHEADEDEGGKHADHLHNVRSESYGRRTWRSRFGRGLSIPAVNQAKPTNGQAEESASENTPLLSGRMAQTGRIADTDAVLGSARPGMLKRNASMKDRVVSFVRDTKSTCDADGPCYGYTDPCGNECLKPLSSRSALTRHASLDSSLLRYGNAHSAPQMKPLLAVTDEEDEEPYAQTTATTELQQPDSRRSDHDRHSHDHDHDDSASSSTQDVEAGQHHHHVPTNEFLSIGLQTVIAITLHKFPEGFITYATNHANPTLGFNIFMALFVHNIAEGFAMALPLYMAIGSRWKAILWSSLLGGFSQPLGAGIAVAVLKLSEGRNVEIDSTAYACLFAITAGIMASVALQLFVESLSLNHNRNLSIAFAFLGMVLLGVSNALVR